MKKLSSSDNQNKTPTQLGFENTQSQPVLQNSQTPEGIVYDTSLKNSVEKKKTSNCFFKTAEDQNGGMTWNNIPIKKAGGNLSSDWR